MNILNETCYSPANVIINELVTLIITDKDYEVGQFRCVNLSNLMFFQQ